MLSALLVFPLIGVVPLAQAADKPNLFFNVTFEAASPFISYGARFFKQTFSNTTDNPENQAEGNSWVTWYDNRALANYTRGEAGWGQGHNEARIGTASITEQNPPTMLVSFAGTDMWVWGDVRALPTPEMPTPIVFSMDSTNIKNVTPTADPDQENSFLLGSAGGVAYDNHQGMIMSYGGDLRIDMVMVTTGVRDTGNTTSRTASYKDLVSSIGRTEPFVKNNALNPFYTFTGNWTVRNRLGNTTPVVTHDHAVGSSKASVKFDVPQNSSFILLSGTVGPDNGLLSTDWNVKPPSLKVTVFATYNPYVSAENIFMASLDPEVQYTVTMSSDGPGNNNSVFGTYDVGLSDVVFLGVSNSTAVIDNTNSTSNSTDNANGTSISNGTDTGAGANSTAGATAHKSNKSAIIGGVVGGVGGALLLALLAFLVFCWRRNAQRQKYEEPAKFEVDDSQAVTSPFSTTETKNHLLNPHMNPANHAAFLTDEPVPNTLSPVDIKNRAGGYSAAALSPGVSGGPSTSFQPPTAGHASAQWAAGPSSGAAASNEAYINPKARPFQPAPTQIPVPPPAPSAPPPVARHFAQEEDGGSVPVVNDIELIPPSYREEWSAAGSIRRGSETSNAESFTTARGY